MRRISAFVLPFSAAIALILCCCAAFVGLTGSSLWVDELFTAYFADPAQATSSDVILRAAEDVHPPGYYLLVWAVARQTGLDFVLASRGASAVLAILALGLVALAPTRTVTALPRVLAAAFAASSYMWFEYSQEARSYALCFMLVAGLMCFALRCIAPLQSGRIPVGPLAGVVMVSVLAALSHYYAVLLSGAVFSMLLCFCRSWRAFFTVSLSGLFVLAVASGFVAWHVPRMLADSSQTWFSADASFLVAQTRIGLGDLLGRTASRLFILLLIVLTLVASMLRPIGQTWALLKDGHFWMPVVFLAGVFGLTIAYGVGVTIGVVQMFSFRLFVLLAPVLWIGLAYALHVFLCQTPPGRLRLGASLVLALALLGATAIVQNRGALDSQAWRQSAHIISELEGCSAATLPVMWWDQPFTGDDSPEWFYGYYLPAAPERDWITIPRNEALVGLTSEHMGALVAATATGARSCPVVLWSVHMHGATSIEEMQEALQAHVPADAQMSVKAQIILPPEAEYWEHARLFTLEAVGQ